MEINMGQSAADHHQIAGSEIAHVITINLLLLLLTMWVISNSG